MKLRILTPTRGESTHWSAAAASITAFAPDAEHVVICPESSNVAREPHPGGRTIVRDDGGGMYAALNRGLRAPGHWDAFTWLNDDDLLAKGCQVAWKKLQAQPEAGISYGRVGLIDGEGKGLGELPVASRAGDLVALLIRGIMPLAQPGTIIRRSVIESAGALDVSFRLAGDLDFFVRALAAGVRFSYCDEIVGHFRLHAGQLSKQEALNNVEFDRAVSRLRSGNRTKGFAALARFRWANRRVYWDRWRRHGRVTMRELYRRG